MFIKHSYFAHFLLLFIAEQILEAREVEQQQRSFLVFQCSLCFEKVGQEKLVLVKCQKMHLSHHKYLQNETFFSKIIFANFSISFFFFSLISRIFCSGSIQNFGMDTYLYMYQYQGPNFRVSSKEFGAGNCKSLSSLERVVE